MRYDVIVVGSNFGGAITGLVLNSLGYKVCVIDQKKHPRFSIGESSTPLADRSLARIADKYGIGRLADLSAYGSASKLEEVTVGPKRGFSYFFHKPEREFLPDPSRENELLVAASADYETSDTNWLRSDVDAFIADMLLKSGVELIEGFSASDISKTKEWSIGDRKNGESLLADFVVDASGGASLLPRALGIRNRVDLLQTNSRAVYSHFESLKRWTESYAESGGDASPHPFDSSHAALHHVIEEGWMWQLNFDNGLDSCGMVFDQSSGPSLHGWDEALAKYPSIGRQFETARIADVPGGMIETKRLQYLFERGSGDGWLALPFSIGFIDPLHSTGIAHTLHAVETIGRIFSKGLPSENDLHVYSEETLRELNFIDTLVSTAYSARNRPGMFIAAVMLYFVATINAERTAADAGFLSANVDSLRESVSGACREVKAAVRNPAADTEKVVEEIAESVRDLDQVGLFDKTKQNMHSHTAYDGKIGIRGARN